MSARGKGGKGLGKGHPEFEEDDFSAPAPPTPEVDEVEMDAPLVRKSPKVKSPKKPKHKNMKLAGTIAMVGEEEVKSWFEMFAELMRENVEVAPKDLPGLFVEYQKM